MHRYMQVGVQPCKIPSCTCPVPRVVTHTLSIYIYYIILLIYIIIIYNCISLGSHPSPQDLVSCLHSWMLL